MFINSMKDCKAEPRIDLPGFDHIAGDLVDVFRNEDGEFVQVWNERRNGNIDAVGRVVLSYLRASNGPQAVSHTFVLEGEYSSVTIESARRTFEYRDNVIYKRTEIDLQSGRVIVDDARKGVAIVQIWTREFDWVNYQPVGKSLNDSEVCKLQQNGRSWFKSTYQDAYIETERKVHELVQVESFKGNRMEELFEIRNGTPLIRVAFINGSAST